MPSCPVNVEGLRTLRMCPYPIGFGWIWNLDYTNSTQEEEGKSGCHNKWMGEWLFLLGEINQSKINGWTRGRARRSPKNAKAKKGENCAGKGELWNLLRFNFVHFCALLALRTSFPGFPKGFFRPSFFSLKHRQRKSLSFIDRTSSKKNVGLILRKIDDKIYKKN